MKLYMKHKSIKNKYNITGQDTKPTKSHRPLLVSSVNLNENNTKMAVLIVPQKKSIFLETYLQMPSDQ